MPLEKDGVEDLIVPEDIAAGPVGLPDHLLLEADRFFRLGIVMGGDFQSRLPVEVAEQLLSEILILAQ